MAVDPEKLNQFIGKFLGDVGAAIQGPSILIGEQLGLYKSLAASGPINSAALPEKTGIPERYAREWLASQAASGYIEDDGDTDRYWMTPEQTFALTVEDNPVTCRAFSTALHPSTKTSARSAEAIKAGKGFGWHEHQNDLFIGTKKFFRPGYLANLVSSWLPALDGMISKLQTGARVADVGCGLGASTIIMAKAFPKSNFTGFDYHLESIEYGLKTMR